MKFEILRIHSSDDHNGFTNGILFQVDQGVRKFLAYTLEDEKRDEKIRGETRIPAGVYKLSLWAGGSYHARYQKKFADQGPDWWQGSIVVNDVPGFTGILWHLGNFEKNTMGCLLLGSEQKTNNFIGDSKGAFLKVYPIVRDAIKSWEEVTAHYIDYDGKISLSNKSTDDVMLTEAVDRKYDQILKDVRALKDLRNNIQ